MDHQKLIFEINYLVNNDETGENIIVQKQA